MLTICKLNTCPYNQESKCMREWIDCNEAGVCTVAASLVINLATGQPQFNPVLLGLARKPPILDAELCSEKQASGARSDVEATDSETVTSSLSVAENKEEKKQDSETVAANLDSN